MNRRFWAILAIGLALAVALIQAAPAPAAPMDPSWVAKWRADLAFMADSVPSRHPSFYHAVSRGTYSAPVLADLDKDGKLDVIQAAFDANIYAFKADGTNVPGQTCNGISVGIGFDAKRIANPTKVVAPPPPPPNPCP